MYQINKCIVKILCCIMAFASTLMQPSFGISPDLNYPRVGDELTLLELKNIRNSDGNYVDLSNAYISAKSDFRVYAPANEDTLTAMLIANDKRYVNLVSINRLLYMASSTQPGQTRIFSKYVPYQFFTDSLSAQVVESEGTLSRIGKYCSHGRRYCERFPNYTLVTLDCDTLMNVECIKTNTDEEFIYAGMDTIRHIGSLKQWYVSGYRYPVLTLSDDFMLSIEGDTIDHVCRCEAIDMKHQEDAIVNDPVNELLRTSKKEFKSYNSFDYGNNLKNASFKIDNIEWNVVTKTLTLLPDLKGNQPMDYVLCDAFGRVYASGKSNTEESISISLKSYPENVYIFAFFDARGINTLKISNQ